MIDSSFELPKLHQTHRPPANNSINGIIGRGTQTSGRHSVQFYPSDKPLHHGLQHQTSIL